MSAVLPELLRADSALPRVLDFTRRHGRAATALAMHAAVPLGLTPELVHLLRFNFVPSAPFIAEADLLLSPLCRELGGGMYEMDADVRELLLGELGRAAAYGPERVRDVARLLLLHATRELHDAADSDVRDHLRVQQWVGLSYLDAGRAAEELAGALRAGVERGERQEALRVVRLTSALASPLLAEVELMRYAAAVGRAAEGDIAGAFRLAAPGGTPAETVVGRERLPGIDRVIRLWSPPAETPPEVSQGVDTAQAPAGGGYHVAKVVVLGDPGVGKTLLVERLADADSLTGFPTHASNRRVRWEAQSGQVARDIVFLEPDREDDFPLGMELGDAAAMLMVVAGGEGAESAARWMERVRSATGGAPPPGLLVHTGAAPDFHRVLTISREHGLSMAVEGDAASGRGIGELRGHILHVIDWDRQPAAASREHVDRAEHRMLHALEAVGVVRLDERPWEVRSALAATGDSDEVFHAMLRCLAARGRVRLLGDPPYAMVADEVFRSILSHLLESVRTGFSGLPAALSEQVWALDGPVGKTILESGPSGSFKVVLEELVRLRYAFLADTRRGRYVVVPSEFRVSIVPESAVERPTEEAIEARWRGSVRDHFVLLLVHLGEQGRVEVISPTTARVHREKDWIDVHAVQVDETALLLVSVSRDFRGIDDLLSLVRDRVSAYLPSGVDASFTEYEGAGSRDLEVEAAPSPGLSTVCAVVLPFGRRSLVGQWELDFDAVWRDLYVPAISATHLPEGGTLEPVRVSLPRLGDPLPEKLQRARLVLVDVTGLDMARLWGERLVPGARTQHVLLLRAASASRPEGLGDLPCEVYVLGPPDLLKQQIETLAGMLRKTLEIPSTGPGEPDAGGRMPPGAIYISYVPEDREAAERLYAGLSQITDVWLDRTDLTVGDDWAGRIRRNINECSLFFPVISRSSAGRPEGIHHIEWEVAVRRRKYMAPELPFITPVVVDDIELSALPKEFSTFNVTRLPGGEVTPEFVRQVERGVRFARAARGYLSPEPDAEEGRREQPVSPRKPRSEVEVAGVRLTDPDKVLFPDTGLTKLQLARYYDAVGERWMLPYIAGRPLTLVRAPDGAGGRVFYQKHAHEDFPPQVERVAIIHSTGEKEVYTCVASVSGLVAMVEMGVLELHVWGSRRDDPERPDLFVLDLDPGAGVPWDRVVESAFSARDLLSSLGLRSWCKTTGGSGLHVVVPLTGQHTWDQVKEFTHRVCVELALHAPGRYVTKSNLAKRKGKIFLDYLRNARGSTSISAYGVRAKRTAPVSFPVDWKELTSIQRPDQFTPDVVLERLRQLKSDPWEEFYRTRQGITEAMRRAVGDG